MQLNKFFKYDLIKMAASQLTTVPANRSEAFAMQSVGLFYDTFFFRKFIINYNISNQTAYFNETYFVKI